MKRTIEALKNDAERLEILLGFSPNIPTPDKGEIRDFMREALRIIDAQAEEIEKLKK